MDGRRSGPPSRLVQEPEDTGLIANVDKDVDGWIRYRSGSAFDGKVYLTT